MFQRQDKGLRNRNCGNTGNVKESDLIMLPAKGKWFGASSFYLCKIHFEIHETRHLRFKSQILCMSVCMWCMCLCIILEVHMLMRLADVWLCTWNPEGGIGCLPQLFYTSFLRQDFSLKSELAESLVYLTLLTCVC